MDRTERTGIAIALIGHVGLFALLMSGLLQPAKLPKIENEPVEVELVSEIAPVSRAPDPSPTPPAPKLAPESGSPVDAAAAPDPIAEPPPVTRPVAPPPPKPEPKPEPRPVPKPVPPKPKPALPKPAPIKPAPARPAMPTRPAPIAKPATGKPRPPAAVGTPSQKPVIRPGTSRPGTAVRPTGALNGLLNGVGAAAGTSPAPKPAAAAKPGPPAIDKAVVLQALAQEIGRQIKPRWKSPTGADVDQLVTKLSWDLNPDGSLAGEPRFVSQSGENPSNQSQAKLHRENAIKAVRAAAPFKLPAEHYALWKSIISFRFDKRLSQ